MEPAARQTFAHNRKEEPRPQVTVCALRRSRRSLPAFRQTDHKGLRSREPLGDGTAKGGMEDDRKAVIHAVISSHEGWYVAECLEVAVVTQGRSLDEALANLRSALELRLSDERLARAGLSSSPQPDRELRVSGLHDLMPRLRRGTEKPRWFRLCGHINARQPRQDGPRRPGRGMAGLDGSDALSSGDRHTACDRSTGGTLHCGWRISVEVLLRLTGMSQAVTVSHRDADSFASIIAKDLLAYGLNVRRFFITESCELLLAPPFW